jgi:anti-anti-sigma regulatory factor
VPVTIEQSGAVCFIRVEGEVTIAGGAGLKKILLEALGSGKELRLDMAGAIEVDITALQLLWAAEREARASGTAFTLEGAVPDDILATAIEAGLGKFPVIGGSAIAGLGTGVGSSG